jgi:hypothetical protein
MNLSFDHANDVRSDLTRELAALPTLSAAQLRQRYAEVFGEPSNTGNKTWLVKRLAWRLQALAEGDLSKRARQRAAQLANDADLRLSPPKPPCQHQVATPAENSRLDADLGAVPLPVAPTDPRLPTPGSTITRLYKGRQLRVTVLQNGFAYDGQVFISLSALAKAITGSHRNGFLFFGLTQRRATDHSTPPTSGGTAHAG